jgi:hypothetical protein
MYLLISDAIILYSENKETLKWVQALTPTHLKICA